MSAEPRPLKELYQLLLDNHDETAEIKGLCSAIRELLYDNLITDFECVMLERSLNENRPSMSLHKEYFVPDREVWWWDPTDQAIRKAFIQHLINLL